MERNISTNSIDHSSSSDITGRLGDESEDNQVEWEMKMNGCLQEKLNEINQIMQVQKKLTTAGENSDLAGKVDDTSVGNHDEWGMKMYDSLQEKLKEINQIAQVQEKLTTVGENNYNQLKERNEELQEKLQEEDFKNKSLKYQMEDIHEDDLSLDHEEGGNDKKCQFDGIQEDDLSLDHKEETNWNSLNMRSTHGSYNQPSLQTHDRKRLGWLYRIGNSGGSSIYNTQSIHMYAIFVTTSDTFNSNLWRYAQSWLVAMVSLLVVSWQILTLFFLILEFQSSTENFNTNLASDADPCVKFRIDLQFNLVFLLFLFAVVLSKDIEETVIEQALLDSRAVQIESQGKYMPIQVQLISFSLRIQKYTLPWYVGTTAFFAFIAESPSVPYILLSLLTIGFTTVIDKMVSAFFLTHDQRALADQLVRNAQQDKDVTVSISCSRLLGLAATTMIFGLTRILESGLDDICGFYLGEFLSFLIFTLILPFFTILVPSIASIYFNQRDQTRMQKIFRAIVEFIRNTAAFSFVILLTLIALKVSLGEEINSLFGLGMHLQGYWFWLVVALLTICPWLYCTLYYYMP